MGAFNGQLRSNEIFASLYNMIISQEVFADNIKGTFSSLVDKGRVDGSLYGDTKLYYAVDVLKSSPWGNDAEATNLLALHRPPAPDVQAIHLDIFRQISLTVDNYLSKRAWGDEYAFSQFNSVMLGMIRETKRVYDSTIYNSFIGTAESSATKGIVNIDITTATTGVTDKESVARIEAQTIAQGIADLFIGLRDITRDYNDYGNLRSVNEEDLVVVWNSKWVNKITKIDLPTIFHKDGLMDKFEEEVLPYRYFGDLLDATLATASVYDASTNPTGMFTKAGNNYTIVNTGSTAYKVKSLIETDYTVSSVVTHVFPGDTIPVGAVLTITSSTVPFAYLENADKICVVMHKRSVPYMSAFEVGTSFFNQKSLTENHYLTFGHNTLEYLKNYPFIVVKKI